jgi:hypothetical protein
LGLSGIGFLPDESPSTMRSTDAIAITFVVTLIGALLAIQAGMIQGIN